MIASEDSAIDDEVNATRWADLSEGARFVLLGGSPVNVSHLRALIGRGYTDEVGNLTERGRELVEWRRARGWYATIRINDGRREMWDGRRWNDAESKA